MRSFPRSRAAGETVREIVARILLEEIADPRVDLVTVTGVEMSSDLRHANVFVTANGGPERYAETLDGLNAAKGRIRAILGTSVRMRYVPDLHFKIDPAVDEAIRITEALRVEREARPVSDEPDPTIEEAGEDA
jgi:ribosome-binding factor A